MKPSFYVIIFKTLHFSKIIKKVNKPNIEFLLFISKAIFLLIISLTIINKKKT